MFHSLEGTKLFMFAKSGDNKFILKSKVLTYKNNLLRVLYTYAHIVC